MCGVGRGVRERPFDCYGGEGGGEIFREKNQGPNFFQGRVTSIDRFVLNAN